MHLRAAASGAWDRVFVWRERERAREQEREREERGREGGSRERERVVKAYLGLLARPMLVGACLPACAFDGARAAVALLFSSALCPKRAHAAGLCGFLEARL